MAFWGSYEQGLAGASLRLHFRLLCWNVLLLVPSLLFLLSLIRFASRHYSDSYICNCPSCCTPPRMLPRGQGYGRSFTTGQVGSHGAGWGRSGVADAPLSISCPTYPRLAAPCLTHHSPQINDELNHQFEAVCESVFGEVESQAVEALDLPGCFRMRSHSYLRAIQAGCSQDDECLSLFSMSAPAGPPITSSILKPSTCESWGILGGLGCARDPRVSLLVPSTGAAAPAPAPCPGQPPAQGVNIPLVAQPQSQGFSVSPAPVCHSLFPSTSFLPISVPCWVLQQRGSGVLSNPFLGMNWPNSPSELQLRP